VDNMKPKRPDEQEIPFRLRELMRSREAMKRPNAGRKRAAGGVRGCPGRDPGPGQGAHGTGLQLEAARSCSGASSSPPVTSQPCPARGEAGTAPDCHRCSNVTRLS